MTVRATFDGKAFIPETPIHLSPGESVTLTVSPNDAAPLSRLAELAEQNPITDSPPNWLNRYP